jgi:hypothetical protein
MATTSPSAPATPVVPVKGSQTIVPTGWMTLPISMTPLTSCNGLTGNQPCKQSAMFYRLFTMTGASVKDTVTWTQYACHNHANL